MRKFWVKNQLLYISDLALNTGAGYKMKEEIQKLHEDAAKCSIKNLDFFYEGVFI